MKEGPLLHSVGLVPAGQMIHWAVPGRGANQPGGHADGKVEFSGHSKPAGHSSPRPVCGTPGCGLLMLVPGNKLYTHI